MQLDKSTQDLEDEPELLDVQQLLGQKLKLLSKVEGYVLPKENRELLVELDWALIVESKQVRMFGCRLYRVVLNLHLVAK